MTEFYRNYEEYAAGFGDPFNEYWLGEGLKAGPL